MVEWEDNVCENEMNMEREKSGIIPQGFQCEQFTSQKFLCVDITGQPLKNPVVVGYRASCELRRSSGNRLKIGWGGLLKMESVVAAFIIVIGMMMMIATVLWLRGGKWLVKAEGKDLEMEKTFCI